MFPLHPSACATVLAVLQAGTRTVAAFLGAGIGFETAKALLQKGYYVVLGCRDKTKAEAARAQLRCANRCALPAVCPGAHLLGCSLASRMVPACTPILALRDWPPWRAFASCVC